MLRNARSRAVQACRDAVSAIARVPALQRPIFATYGKLFPDRIWKGAHPFDQHYGVETSGYLPAVLLQSAVPGHKHPAPYAGCYPASVRAGLASLPDPSGFTFIDLGCGKGRGLVLGSEWPFRAILGVELSPELARIARDNAVRIKARHPERPSIEVMVADAALAPLPPGPKVVFIYNPFGREVLRHVVERLAAEAESSDEEVFVAYENPVYADLLDGAPAFARWFAAHVASGADERAFVPDDGDGIVLWRAAGPARTAHRGAEAQITITEPGVRAFVS
jgi:SAM-dependent methyltransferase